MRCARSTSSPACCGRSPRRSRRGRETRKRKPNFQAGPARHAGPAFSLYNRRMEANTGVESIDAEVRQRCERLLKELYDSRRHLDATPGRLSAPAAAMGIAAVDDAIAATANVLAQASGRK